MELNVVFLRREGQALIAGEGLSVWVRENATPKEVAEALEKLAEAIRVKCCNTEVKQGGEQMEMFV